MSKLILFTIEERTYGMRKMPPIKGAAFALKVATFLANLIGSGEDVLGSFKKLASDLELDEKELANDSVLVQRLFSLVGAADPNKLQEIFQEAFSYEVYCEEKKLTDLSVFEDHFAQYPSDLFPVAIWATYNHVKDFFVGIGAGAKALSANSRANLT